MRSPQSRAFYHGQASFNRFASAACSSARCATVRYSLTHFSSTTPLALAYSMMVSRVAVDIRLEAVSICFDNRSIADLALLLSAIICLISSRCWISALSSLSDHCFSFAIASAFAFSVNASSLARSVWYFESSSAYSSCQLETRHVWTPKPMSASNKGSTDYLV